MTIQIIFADTIHARKFADFERHGFDDFHILLLISVPIGISVRDN